MTTTQELIDSLKRDKANLNSMLNSMGVETTGNETFTKLVPLVGKIVTDPILQDKSITITENGTTNIVADEGYDGLNTLKVTTNVPTSGGGENTPTEYIQDGLIAYFDARDDLVDGKWLSRIGDDYFYQSYPTNSTTMVDLKTSNAIVNDGTISIINTKDYLLEDYTFEVVAKMTDSKSSEFLSFDKNQSPHINIGREAEGQFCVMNVNNDGARNYYEKKYTNLVNKRCTFSINFLAMAPRGTASYQPRIYYTLNGEKWNLWGLKSENRYSGGVTINNGSNYKKNVCCLLGYYDNQYHAIGEVNCLRVYNRKLTEAELLHNHKVDIVNFNLSE